MAYSTSANLGPSLSTLAPELIANIFKHLNYAGATILSLTCKALYGYHFEVKERLQPVSWQIAEKYDGSTLASNLDLRETLKKWVPEDIVYNPFVGKFTSWERLSDLFERDREARVLAYGSDGFKGAVVWTGRIRVKESIIAGRSLQRYHDGIRPHYTPTWVFWSWVL